MSVSSLKLDIDDFFVLNGNIIDSILAKKSGDLSILYIYIMRKGKNFSHEKAQNDLDFSKSLYEKLLYELVSMNAVGTKNDINTSLSFIEKPKYSVKEIKKYREDTTFDDICTSAENILAIALNQNYITSLLYIYDALKLPGEVIIELLVYLKDKLKRTPKKMEIEKEAHKWVDSGIITHDKAINYIANSYALKPVFDSMARALKIYDREPTPTEERYILAFIEYGFSDDIVDFAVNKMLKTLNKFSFKYLNKILLTYKENNLLKLEDILKNDPNYQKNTQNSSISSPKRELEPWEIEFLNEIRGG